tara:strand:- start:118 stop:756 length:639 start_codon:yes stop_codon:yes gene_type:complete
MQVVLVEPKEPGNIGAVARAMKNFGYSQLVLVNPQCSITEETRNRAKHAQDVLHKVKILKRFPKADFIVGTTGQLGTDYNLLRSVLTPEQLMVTKKTALVFGREDQGLSNEELAKCDVVVTIPTNKKYPVLNLSHAVAVVLYELSKKKEHFTPLPAHERKQLLSLINKSISKLPFSTVEKKDTQKKVWKNLLGKSKVTKREGQALFGFFRKL